MYFDLPFDTEETVATGDYAIASYLVSGVSEADALKKAGGFATGQTVGTWLPLPGVTREMVEGYQARVLSLQAIPCDPPMFTLRVAFPAHNFEGSLAMLQTAMVGNDVSTALCLKLMGLSFTRTALERFPGPRQSVNGIREATGVWDRPLVLNMLKPCVGYTPEEGAKLFMESALGGVDLIKDDEVHGETDISDVVRRANAYGRAAKAVRERMGRAPVYVPNITARPRKMRQNALAVLEEGVRGVMVNAVATGYDALWDLTEEFGDRLFFLSHYAGAGMMCADTVGYHPSVLLGTLPRLAGADTVMTMLPGKPGGAGWLSFLQTVQAQRLPMGKLKPTMTMVGGGVSPLNLGAILAETGKDTILGVGGAVQGHPMGTSAGGKAVLAAIDCAMTGQPLAERARDCVELKAALEAWG